MVLSKLDLAIVTVVAAGLLWVEHEHRIIIATPAAADVAPPAASACPEKDSVPFSADCIAFIEGAAAPAVPARSTEADSSAALPPDPHGADLSSHADAHDPACPASNENGPYSARCLKFMSGWYWHPNPAERTP